jgi:hypothetical protein
MHSAETLYNVAAFVVNSKPHTRARFSVREFFGSEAVLINTQGSKSLARAAVRYTTDAAARLFWREPPHFSLIPTATGYQERSGFILPHPKIETIFMPYIRGNWAWAWKIFTCA